MSSAALRALTGIQHMLARHRPSVQVQAVTSFAAQTAPLVSFGKSGGEQAVGDAARQLADLVEAVAALVLDVGGAVRG